MPFETFKLPFLKISKLLKLFGFLFVAGVVGYLVYYRLTLLEAQIIEMNIKQANFEKNYEDTLFSDHLKIMSVKKLEFDLALLNGQISATKSSDVTNLKVTEIYGTYDDFTKKLTRNTQVKLKVEDSQNTVKDWGAKLLNKDYDGLLTSISEESKKLDEAYNKYIASLPKAPVSGGGQGYSYVTVDTERGKFGMYLIKLPYSDINIKTVSANEDSCKDNCPTKSLADYVKENSGYAGINGSYFCPPDYDSCSGKVNSYDYAFYNSNKKKWLNKGALTWFETGLITFNGGSAKFYSKTSDYDGGSVTGGISNYPSLLKDGKVIVDSGDLTSYQKDAKGSRGVIGLGGDNIYLAIINGATVIDAAYAMKAVGATHALNIDGGGSSALYMNGGYIVGPGRSLPNAVVIVKK